MKLPHYLPLKVLCCILKTLRYLALKTVVTGSHDFSEEIARKGEKGRRRHCLAVKTESQFLASNPLFLRFSPNHNKSTVNAFIRKRLPTILVFSVNAMFSWMSATEKRQEQMQET